MRAADVLAPVSRKNAVSRTTVDASSSRPSTFSTITAQDVARDVVSSPRRVGGSNERSSSLDGGRDELASKSSSAAATSRSLAVLSPV